VATDTGRKIFRFPVHSQWPDAHLACGQIMVLSAKLACQVGLTSGPMGYFMPVPAQVEATLCPRFSAPGEELQRFNQPTQPVEPYLRVHQ